MKKSANRKGKRDNFTMLPNILDEMDLSPYAIRLYFRIKRRAGEDGKCWENSRNLAMGCKMSRSMITKAKRELEQAKLITIEMRLSVHGYKPGHIIRINNEVWKWNEDKYGN
jgi:hypothetical protein